MFLKCNGRRCSSYQSLQNTVLKAVFLKFDQRLPRLCQTHYFRLVAGSLCTQLDFLNVMAGSTNSQNTKSLQGWGKLSLSVTLIYLSCLSLLGRGYGTLEISATEEAIVIHVKNPEMGLPLPHSHGHAHSHTCIIIIHTPSSKAGVGKVYFLSQIRSYEAGRVKYKKSSRWVTTVHSKPTENIVDNKGVHDGFTY